MNKILFLVINLLVIGFGTGFTYAQTGDNFFTGNFTQQICDTIKPEILGAKEIKVGMQNDFIMKIDENNINISSEINKINYYLYKGGDIVAEFTGAKFSQIFLTTGDYVLLGKINNKSGCELQTSINIKVYNSFITYLGDSYDNYNVDYKQIYNTKGFYLNSVILGEKNVLQDDWIKNIESVEKFLKYSDYIIINNSNFPKIFEILGKYSNKIDFTNTKFVLIVDSKNNYLTTNLLNYIKIVGKKRIFVVEKRDFFVFMNDLILKSNVLQENYVSMLSVNYNETYNFRILSYIINNLIYSGIPTSLISILLSLCAIFLILNISKQIIGLSTFGLFTPILFGLSVVIIGIKTSIILLVIGTISYFLMIFLTKFVYLLYTAKIALLGTMSIILLLIYLWIDQNYGLNMINYDMLNNVLIIFPLMYTILRSKDVVDEDLKVLSLSFWFGILEFVIIVFIVYFFLTYNELNYLLLVYPEIIVIIFILNIVIGRFIGLQLLEYFRFLPLIRKHLEE